MHYLDGMAGLLSTYMAYSPHLTRMDSDWLVAVAPTYIGTYLLKCR